MKAPSMMMRSNDDRVRLRNADDLDGTRKIIAKILSLWPNEEGGPFEE